MNYKCIGTLLKFSSFLLIFLGACGACPSYQFTNKPDPYDSYGDMYDTFSAATMPFTVLDGY